MRKKLSLLVAIAMSLTVALTGSTSASAADVDTTKLNLVKSGTLVVGMTLQFPPQMYLNARQKPAGYDYALLKKLSKDLGLKLEIRNLAFAGLIPGLVAKQFDMVSVGLGKNPDREKSMTYVGEYMPYSTILVSGRNDKTAATIAGWNVAGKKITALQGSLAATKIKEVFPNATLIEFPTQDAAFLEVASGRADGIVAEANLFGYFSKNNPGLLKQVPLAQDLRNYFGHWTVQLGNTALQKVLKDWLCEQNESGWLSTTFRREMGYKMPPLPKCTA
jgi:ABC-type amino acid transport substrate-binding protein